MTEKELAALWADLAGADAVKARLAIRALVSASEDSVPVLAERLRADRMPGAKEITSLIAKLDDDSFAGA